MAKQNSAGKKKKSIDGEDFIKRKEGKEWVAWYFICQ